MKDKKGSAVSILRAANTLICHTSFFGGLDLAAPALCPGGRKCSLSWGGFWRRGLLGYEYLRCRYRWNCQRRNATGVSSGEDGRNHNVGCVEWRAWPDVDKFGPNFKKYLLGCFSAELRHISHEKHRSKWGKVARGKDQSPNPLNQLMRPHTVSWHSSPHAFSVHTDVFIDKGYVCWAEAFTLGLRAL